MLYSLFDLVFRPVFYLKDDITGKTEVYDGLYNLTIIGFGHTEDNIKHYNEAEKAKYNFQRGCVLI